MEYFWGVVMTKMSAAAIYETTGTVSMPRKSIKSALLETTALPKLVRTGVHEPLPALRFGSRYHFSASTIAITLH